MAKKISAKQGKDFFDTRSGRVLADLNFAERSSANPKTEIGFIREAFPLRSKDDITLVLQSCDYNVDAAIACFTNGEADNLLKEWNTQGRKSKNTRKKRNKKKQVKNSDPETPDVAVIPQDNEIVSQLNQNNHEEVPVTSEEDAKKPSHTTSTSLECPSQSLDLHHLHPPSPSSSEISLPSSNSDQPTDALQDAQTSLKHTPGTSSLSNHANVKFERSTSTGPDALKKTVKDLQRSSVSLPRFQLLLEEECDKSFKSITEMFQELRQCLNNRETHLLAQMAEFKKQAVDLLEQRQENAAALKLKSDRVGGMREAEVTQLRSEIKNFVTERKIDEELARTTRFVADKDQLLSVIANFGEVVAIKSCYSPVALNPPPLPTKKVEKNNTEKKAAAENVSSLKPPTPSAPTNSSVPTNTTSDDNKSLSSQKALQEVAELHAKLQAALQQQGLASSTGKQVEGQKQSKPEHKNNRPNSAPQAVGKQQISQRPQTALPQNQQRRKDQNPQHERTRQNRSAETRIVEQDRQYNNQSRNSRGSNQRRGRQRNPRPEISNEKNEVPKNKGTLSAQNLDSAQQEAKSDESVTSQGKEKEKVVSPQPETVKGGVQSGNKNLQPRDQRVARDERPRNRERRRGGRRGGAEGQNTTNGKGPLNGPGEKRENGPIKDGPVEKGTLEKEDMKTAVSEQGEHDFEKSTNKEDGPIVVEKTVEGKNEASSLQGGPVLNGVGAYTGSNTAHSLNGEHTHGPEKEGEVNKGALPQRRDRPSRRRGAQKDQKDGPGSQKHLNGTKPIENGTGEDHGKEESMAENKIQKSTENAQSEKQEVKSEKQEVKSENQTTQELEKDLDKAGASKANGYIPLKEVNEVNIDR